MSETVTRLRKTAVERALHGVGQASGDARRAAFENSGSAEPVRPLVDKIARTAWKVTDEDITAVKSAGVPEDQIFELAVCAALGQATRQLDTALAALDAAVANPGDVR